MENTCFRCSSDCRMTDNPTMYTLGAQLQDKVVRKKDFRTRASWVVDYFATTYLFFGSQVEKRVIKYP